MLARKKVVQNANWNKFYQHQTEEGMARRAIPQIILV